MNYHVDVKHSITKKQRLNAAIIVAVIIFITVVAVLIGNGTVNSTSLFGYCGFEQRHNMPCAFCGMTSSVCRFVKGDIIGSYEMQPAAGLFSTVAALLLIYFIFRAMGFPLNKITAFLQRLRPIFIIISIAIIILIGWAIMIYNY